jgi:hypothetical protein
MTNLIRSTCVSSPAFKYVGFTDPRRRRERRRAVALAQLIATLALVVSIAVVATVVSIGIARAAIAGDAVHRLPFGSESTGQFRC